MVRCPSSSSILGCTPGMCAASHSPWLMGTKLSCHLHAGNVRRQPLAVADGDEVVLPAVHEQHGNRDLRKVESPRRGLGAAVLPPALTARGEAGLIDGREIQRDSGGHHGG